MFKAMVKPNSTYYVDCILLDIPVLRNPYIFRNWMVCAETFLERQEALYIIGCTDHRTTKGV